MINETTKIAYLAAREPNNMLTEVQVISYGHYKSLCTAPDGQTRQLPTELLFHTRDGAADYARQRFLASIATVKKDLKLLEDQLAYLDKISMRQAA